MTKPPYLDALDFTDDIQSDVFAPVYTEPDSILEREQLRHVLELLFKEAKDWTCRTKGYQSVINDRSVEMLKMRYGIDTGEPATLYMIGRDYDVTGNRVRQVVVKAIRNLRHQRKNNYISDLYDYITEVKL